MVDTVSDNKTPGETSPHTSDARAGWKARRSSKEVVLICLVLACLVTVAVLTILLALKSQTKVSDVCLKKECIEAAAHVLGSMDTSTKPCDNFYDFACGTWMKTHVVPEGRSNLFTYGVVRDNVKVSLKYILESDIEQEVEAMQKARAYYQSCMNESLIEELNASTLLRELDSQGGWPILGSGPGGNWNQSEFDLESSLVRLLYYGVGAVIKIFVGIDEKRPGKRIITLDESYLSFHSKEYYFDDEQAYLREALMTYMVDIAVLLGANEITAREDMADVFKLECRIANLSMSRAEKKNLELQYNKMTIEELQRDYPIPGKDKHVKFHWLSFIQRALDHAGEDVEITTDENVVVSNTRFFKGVFDVLNSTTARTIKNYLVWRGVNFLINRLPSRFREVQTKYDTVQTGATVASRWRTCLQTVMENFSMAVGRLFVKEFFDEQSKHRAVEMIDDIRGAFYERLDSLDWMDSHTRQLAKDKAMNIEENIGYADRILDDDLLNAEYEELHVDKGDYLQSTLNIYSQLGKRSVSELRAPLKKNSNSHFIKAPATVNAFYHLLHNSISFPAGILQPPFYHKHHPRSMNYGSIGFLIGHEITHAFDNSGRQFDKYGNLRQWWSQDVIARFKNKTSCFIDQYSNFVMPKSGSRVDGMFTLGENIADNGGLKQTFKSYKNWLMNNGGHDSTLPGVAFSNEELFFISFAQGWCGVSTEQDEAHKVNTDMHSPARARIVVTLQNFEEFSRVFNCPVGSYMNPVDKCHLW